MNFEGQVAIVTGSAGGLGRSHAMALAARGARVVVNDIGPLAGVADPGSPTQEAVAEINAAGGTAISYICDVTNVEDVNRMVEDTIERWGRIDILINNAGILRDKSFGKMDLAGFSKVIDVHLMGSVNCTKAVWSHMIAQGYGRILMTTSASGIYGNFGQANYGAAKSALVGLMNVLAIEGEAKGIRVNALAPTAATRMTDGLIGEEILDLLSPESISPGAVFLVSDQAPTKTILAAGAGVFAVAQMQESAGLYLPDGARSAEDVAEQWASISDMSAPVVTASAFDQTKRYAEMVLADLGVAS
jgi:NAD(P)-dependent dehydrogenase (short-subunit alcohol dehydrogenase family)